MSIMFQFSSVAQSCPTLCDPMKCSTPGLPVHHQLPESTQTHVHGVNEPSNHLMACCDLWGCKESDTTEWLIWSDLILLSKIIVCFIILNIYVSISVCTVSLPIRMFKLPWSFSFSFNKEFQPHFSHYLNPQWLFIPNINYQLIEVLNVLKGFERLKNQGEAEEENSIHLA